MAVLGRVEESGPVRHVTQGPLPARESVLVEMRLWDRNAIPLAPLRAKLWLPSTAIGRAAGEMNRTNGGGDHQSGNILLPATSLRHSLRRMVRWKQQQRQGTDFRSTTNTSYKKNHNQIPTEKNVSKDTMLLPYFYLQKETINPCLYPKIYFINEVMVGF